MLTVSAREAAWRQEEGGMTSDNKSHSQLGKLPPRLPLLPEGGAGAQGEPHSGGLYRETLRVG